MILIFSSDENVTCIEKFKPDDDLPLDISPNSLAIADGESSHKQFDLVCQFHKA